MVRLSFSKLFAFIFLLTVLLTACNLAPATAPAIPMPPTSDIPERTPTEVALTNTTETTQSASPFVGLPLIDSSNAAQVSVLASTPTFQDANLVWSADGTKFAAFYAFNGTDIQIYSLLSDLPDGALTPLILSTLQPVTGADFSPDGTQLISTGQDGLLRIWDPATGVEVSNLDLTSVFQFAYQWADSVAFSPDGTKLAVFGGQNSAVYLFNYPLDETPPTVIAWLEHASPVVSVYPSPDWQTFAWVGRGTLVWMNADGTLRGEPIGHEDFITNIFFFPDSQRLFVQVPQTVNDLYAGVVIIYDVQTGQVLQTLVHPDFVTTSTLSPDAATLATSSANKVTLWDWVAGTEKLAITDLPDVAQKLVFSPDGRLLVGTFNLGVIQVWDIATGQAVASFQPGGELSGASFVMGGTVLAATQYDGTVQIMGVSP